LNFVFHPQSIVFLQVWCRQKWQLETGPSQFVSIWKYCTTKKREPQEYLLWLSWRGGITFGSLIYAVHIAVARSYRCGWRWNLFF